MSRPHLVYVSFAILMCISPVVIIEHLACMCVLCKHIVHMCWSQRSELSMLGLQMCPTAPRLWMLKCRCRSSCLYSRHCAGSHHPALIIFSSASMRWPLKSPAHFFFWIVFYCWGFFLIYFIYLCFICLPRCMSVHHMDTMPKETREGVRFSGTGVTGSCEPHGC